MGYMYLILGIAGLLVVALWILLDRRRVPELEGDTKNPLDAAGSVYMAEAARMAVHASRSTGQTTELLTPTEAFAANTAGMTVELSRPGNTKNSVGNEA